jgi:hypothetical protein
VIILGALSDSRPVPMNDTPLGQVTGDDDDGDGLMMTKETSNEVKGLSASQDSRMFIVLFLD